MRFQTFEIVIKLPFKRITEALKLQRISFALQLHRLTSNHRNYQENFRSFSLSCRLADGEGFALQHSPFPTDLKKAPSADPHYPKREELEGAL